MAKKIKKDGDSGRFKKILSACKIPVIALFVLMIINFFLYIFTGISAGLLSVIVVFYAGYAATKNFKLNLGASGAVAFLSMIVFGLVFFTLLNILSMIFNLPVPIEWGFPQMILTIAWYSAWAIPFGLIGGFIGQKI